MIAAGGFGITYVAEHELLAKRYAIKEHFPEQFAVRDNHSSRVRPTEVRIFQWTLDRFVQEGRTLVRCKHPSVVAVADVFEANGTAYMVLEYEEGQSLKGWHKSLGRPPSQSDLDALLAPLLDALAYVHSQGLLHRDIAPDNIIVRGDGSPCLIDFGAAREAVAERSHMMSAIVKGGFSPPEQYTRMGKSQGPWSDIYSLAATLYFVLVGRTPQEAPERQIDDQLRRLVEVLGPGHGYRSTFLSAIDAALRLKAGDRPQSIEHLKELLLGEDVGLSELVPRIFRRDTAFAEKKNAIGRPSPIPSQRPIPVIESEGERHQIERLPDAEPARSGAKDPTPAKKSARTRVLWLSLAATSFATSAGLLGGFEYTRWHTNQRLRLEAEAKRQETETQRKSEETRAYELKRLAEAEATAKKRADEERARADAENKRRAEEAKRFEEGARLAFEAAQRADLAEQQRREEQAKRKAETEEVVKAPPVPLKTIDASKATNSDEAAKRKVSPVDQAQGSSSLPAIKTSSSNTVPVCVTPDRLMSYLKSRHPEVDPRFNGIAAEYKRIGEQLGLRWDFAFYQMILETGSLSFRRGNRSGDVRPEQNNFCGLGATGHGEPGESFKDIPTGVRAHLEQLLLYSGESVENPTAERTRKVQEWGVLKNWHAQFSRPITFADLAAKWAPGSGTYPRMLDAIALRFQELCQRASLPPESPSESERAHSKAGEHKQTDSGPASVDGRHDRVLQIPSGVPG